MPMSDHPAAQTVRELIESRSVTCEAREPARAAIAGTLGRYPIVERIGAGGMGEVLAVRDPDIGRTLAAKVIRGEATSDEAFQQFVVEAQLTGQLIHPNIVPLYELGSTADGRLYFTMKRVQGADLSRLLEALREATPAERRGLRLAALNERLSVFVKVCDALAFAHSHDVLHRDLKPANIMVGEFGEVLVMDWGLARRLGAPGGEERRVCGTPHYMPPEQAEGRISELDGRADVYALGALLYEMLTLTCPYGGPTALAVLAQVLVGPPERPTLRAPELAIPPALEAVVLAAMQRDPARRYPTVHALQADVIAVLEDRPVSVARQALRERAARFVRHHPTATLAAALILLFGAVLAGLYGRLQRTERVALVQRGHLERAALLTLAHEGRIDELIAQLGGQRREERDQAIAAFARAYELSQSRSQTIDDLARSIDGATLLETRAAFDRLFAAHQQFGERIPLRPEDWFYRGLLRRLQGDVPGALTDYAEALARRPDWPELLVNRGYARHASLDLAAARADYDRALQLRPNWPMALVGRGSVLFTLGELSLARADFDHALQVEPTHALALCNRGVVRKEQGDVAGAVADFDQSLRHRPGDLDALRYRGGARYAQGDLPGALADYDQVLAADPTRVDALSSRGLVRLNTGDAKGAIADFDRALELDPHWTHALENRGNAKETQGDLVGAIADYDQALALVPDRPDVLNHRGNARQGRGDLVGAIADYDRALALRPDWYSALFNRGNARMARGELREAIADYDRSIAAKPDFPPALTNRGIAQTRLGDPNAAIADYDRALAIDPSFTMAIGQRAHARHAKGESREALGDLTRALVARPSWAEGYNIRGGIRVDTGDLTGALADFDETVRLAPDHWQAWTNRGIVLARLGDPERALESFERAVGRCPPGGRASVLALRARFLGR